MWENKHESSLLFNFWACLVSHDPKPDLQHTPNQTLGPKLHPNSQDSYQKAYPKSPNPNPKTPNFQPSCEKEERTLRLHWRLPRPRLSLPTAPAEHNIWEFANIGI